jgi:putative tricarboxylic transport membrane protein
MMHNVVAGPSLIRQHKDMVYAIILNNMLQAVVLLAVGLVFIYIVSNVVKLRTRYIVPAVLVLATMGTYSINGTLSGPVILFAFTVLGVAMIRFRYPVSAKVVGVLLGRMLETNAILSYQVSGGSAAYILDRPGAIAILAAMVLSLGFNGWLKYRRAKRAASRDQGVASATTRVGVHG